VVVSTPIQPLTVASSRRSRPCRRAWRLAVLLALVVLGAPGPASAYIGPGAGFALLTSGFVLLTTLLAVPFMLAIWPFRLMWRAITRPRRGRARIKRLIVLGFDGQDPRLTDQFMGEGILPNFSALAEHGSYRRLKTTFPALSPVAWSSFSTGVHPARHNIFDFVDRDRRTYLPLLSSARVGKVENVLRIGRLRIPLARPELRLLRKSKPFWTILGEHRIWSTVLRVPITFPPDRFYGAELSAMAVPDLLGTQGTFLLYTTRASDSARREGGVRRRLTLVNDRCETTLEGPENTFVEGGMPLTLPLRVRLDRARSLTHVEIGNTSVTLRVGVLSEWVPLTFSALPGISVRGLSRLMVTELGDHFSLYLSPINLDPDAPAMPISHPPYYATYLARKVGSFATMGLAEDTWARNEGVTDDETFLQQTYDIDGERERMFFAGLDRLRRGSLVCVFDATDRIQHMFWRELDPAHPARRHQNDSPGHAIRDLYRHNDAIVGRVCERLGRDDVLMVISDHGFSSFRRGVNLNQWLQREGYLTLKPGADGSREWLQDVDWPATRAYALGLTGLFLNLQGREAGGVVRPGADAVALKAEIADKLRGLRDDERGEVAINDAFDTSVIYSGPYLENAPDFIIGYNAGYRASWDGASGIVAGPIFEDNCKAWSGDHCIDPRLVPGVFFCNRPVDTAEPSLVDIAPTALELFGIDPPGYMDGRPIAGIA
jgi:predicted AlkP superfamily phosphohydrolase/phosphomutase